MKYEYIRKDKNKLLLEQKSYKFSELEKDIIRLNKRELYCRECHSVFRPSDLTIRKIKNSPMIILKCKNYPKCYEPFEAVIWGREKFIKNLKVSAMMRREKDWISHIEG